MPLQPGQPAPDFKLVSSDKKEVALSDYRGQNVVLLFFPMAFSGVCTAELCAVRDDIASYQGLNAQVLAVSVDSPFTLAKFREDQHLNFPCFPTSTSRPHKPMKPFMKSLSWA
jgi:glutaredoxin-dependent peroxiredoxin